MNSNVLNIKKYSVEDIVKLIIDKKETIDSLYKKVDTSQFNKESKESVVKKIQIVENRLCENLSFMKIIFCVFLPSRMILGLFNVFNPHNELKKGFKRKVNQFYLFSILGSLLYLFIIISLMFMG